MSTPKEQSESPEADEQYEHENTEPLQDNPKPSREDFERVVTALTYPDGPEGAATY